MESSDVQSVIFDRSLWSIPHAKTWLKEHGYIHPKVDKKKHFYRFRQIDPRYFDHFVTKKLDNGIDLIIGFFNSNATGQGFIQYPGNIQPVFNSTFPIFDRRFLSQ